MTVQAAETATTERTGHNLKPFLVQSLHLRTEWFSSDPGIKEENLSENY